MAPLYRIDATKGLLKEDALERHDFRSLALKVFDVVIERMGLGGGATVDDVQAELASFIRATEKDATPERVEAIGQIVVDALLNERERRRAFSESVLEFVNGEAVERTLRFHYLRQEETADGARVFLATIEGINIYTGSLAHDIEDSQAAEEAVLRYQIGRGRIADAVVSARRALAIGLAYEQKIRRAIDSVRRDVSQVDWVADVLRQLDESLHHLRERTSAETEIAEAVRAKADIATPEDRPALAELEERISECQQRHLLLHRTVMNANRAYLDEQARQAFRSRSLASLPDMEAQVLFGALCLNESSASELLDDLLTAFSTPSPQTLCDLDLLEEILLAPRRAEEEEHEELQAPDTEEIATGEQRFSEEDVRFVQLFLDAESRGGRRLSDLLDVAAQRGFSIDLQALVALEVLREYGEPTGTGALSIDRADKDFENAACYGDDLLLVDHVAEEVPVG